MLNNSAAFLLSGRQAGCITSWNLSHATITMECLRAELHAGVIPSHARSREGKTEKKEVIVCRLPFEVFIKSAPPTGLKINIRWVSKRNVFAETTRRSFSQGYRMIKVKLVILELSVSSVTGSEKIIRKTNKWQAVK